MENEKKTAMDFAAKYEIYNAHCHIYPQKIADKAVVSIGNFYDIPMDIPVATSEMLLADGNEFGTKKYLVCSAATDPSQVESINSFIIDECRKHPQFIGFGTLHADYEGGFEKEVQRIIDGGLCGVKLHTDFQKFNIDDEKTYDMYKALEGKLPVLFHMGDNRYDYSAPERLARIMEKFPRLHVFAAHLGGYSAWERAEKSLYGISDNIWYDCSSSLFALSPEKAVELIRKAGVDRVMFGTDFPMWSTEGELLRFMALPLTEEEREKILSINFKKYFGIE